MNKRFWSECLPRHMSTTVIISLDAFIDIMRPQESPRNDLLHRVNTQLRTLHTTDGEFRYQKGKNRRSNIFMVIKGGKIFLLKSFFMCIQRR